MPSRAPAVLALLASFAAVTLLPASSSASTACPWKGSSAAPATKAAQVVRKLTLSEKVQLVSGASNSGPSAGVITGVPRLCIPNLVLNDASAGIGNRQTGTTAFPDEISQAATFDAATQLSMGQALGAEAVAKGVNVVFGPGANLARTPLDGRGFEYAGEDPLLAGQTAAALVRGIQSQHVIATVKHVALNEQETDRTTASSEVSERVAAELYLAPFETAIRSGGAGAAMCSYNRISSIYACQDKALLTGVLRQRLGFTGFVVSDFQATHSTTSSAAAGLDMEMPTGKYYGAALSKAVQNHQVSVATLNAMVTRVLTSMFRIGLIDHPPRAAQATATTANSITVARRVAQQGSVLLKNTGAVLPLTSKDQRIAIIGQQADPNGVRQAIQGYGSAHVPQFDYHENVNDPETAISVRAGEYGGTISYNDGSNANQAAFAASTANVAIVFVNDVENEGIDRPDLKPHSGMCSLTGANTCDYSSLDQDALVAKVAAANPNTIVVLQTGGPVQMPWLSSVAGVVENWLPGQVDGEALAALLFGETNFAGKLPVTFPVKLSDGPLRSASQYPGVKDSKGVRHVTYSEGLGIGYRWYDAKKIKPLFPFGFGLSYTTFGYSGLKLKAGSGGTASVTVTVKNTGKTTGADIVQTYVSAPTSAGEPPKALASYRKVTLAPGASATVTLPLAARAFQVWSSSKHAWVNVVGCYTIRAGDGSTQLPLVGALARNGGHC